MRPQLQQKKKGLVLLFVFGILLLVYLYFQEGAGTKNIQGELIAQGSSASVEHSEIHALVDSSYHLIVNLYSPPGVLKKKVTYTWDRQPLTQETYNTTSQVTPDYVLTYQYDQDPMMVGQQKQLAVTDNLGGKKEYTAFNDPVDPNTPTMIRFSIPAPQFGLNPYPPPPGGMPTELPFYLGLQYGQPIPHLNYVRVVQGWYGQNITHVQTRMATEAPDFTMIIKKRPAAEMTFYQGYTKDVTVTTSLLAIKKWAVTDYTVQRGPFFRHIVYTYDQRGLLAQAEITSQTNGVTDGHVVITFAYNTNGIPLSFTKTYDNGGSQQYTLTWDGAQDVFSVLRRVTGPQGNLLVGYPLLLNLGEDEDDFFDL